MIKANLVALRDGSILVSIGIFRMKITQFSYKTIGFEPIFFNGEEVWGSFLNADSQAWGPSVLSTLLLPA
ncbi:MAG: hypothetical protein RLZZ28_1599 [Bacteroidota bacterium]|jgi:hypothetical protein